MRVFYIFFICVMGFNLGVSNSVLAQKYIKPIDEKYIDTVFVDDNNEILIRVTVPGSPPPDVYSMKSLTVSPDAVMLDEVPALSWSFGCSATSAAMIAGYYDRREYTNMYSGPTNGGVFPLDNSVWGSVVISGETRSLCPLSATMDGLDGHVGNGHVDDYWVKYGSGSDDPYITNGWTQHSYADCTADFMKTNQSAFGNTDGATMFYYYPSGTAYSGSNASDGAYGFQLFVESRGYELVTRYTQLIKGYNNNTNGATFEDYKNEIDAGRPVIINTTGHTMLGVGYDDATQTMYIHNTWDYSVHDMTWGGTYQDDLQHYAISVFQLEAIEESVSEYNYVSSATIDSTQTVCFNATKQILVPGDDGSFILEDGASTTFIAGESIRFLPGFKAEKGSSMSAYITTEALFCDESQAALTANEMDDDLSAQNIDAIEFEDEQDDNSSMQSMVVYPNPNSGCFTVSLKNVEGASRIFIFNSFGQKVYDEHTLDSDILLDLSYLPRGIFFVKAINNNKQLDSKIIIQ